MSFIGQNAYVERDRYYQAIVVIRAGVSGGDLSKIFKDNNIWWWEMASGELDWKPGFEWHYAYLKSTSQNVRPSGIAKELAPAIVVIDDAPVASAMASLLSALELWAAWGMGFDPSEGATMSGEDVLQPETYYTTSAEWASPQAVPTPEEIVARLRPLNIAIFDIDHCMPTIPSPLIEGQGNLIADTVKYYPDHPAFASWFMVASDTKQTAKKIRDALGAKHIYIIRKPFFGTVETKMIMKLCASKVALQNIAFGASRFVTKAADVAGKIADPGYIPAVIGIGAGLVLVWLGAKIYSFGRK